MANGHRPACANNVGVSLGLADIRAMRPPSAAGLPQAPLALSLRPRLVEAHTHVRSLLQVYGIDEPHLAIIERQNHRHGSQAIAEKSHALQ
jgi:hypothetical protein